MDIALSWQKTELYSELCQTYEIDIFADIVNSFCDGAFLQKYLTVENR